MKEAKRWQQSDALRQEEGKLMYLRAENQRLENLIAYAKNEVANLADLHEPELCPPPAQEDSLPTGESLVHFFDESCNALADESGKNSWFGF